MNSIELKTAGSSLTEKELFGALLKISPEPVKLSVPANAEQQKLAFLNGEIDTPKHSYDRLRDIDLNSQREKILNCADLLLSQADIQDSHRVAYEAYISNYLKINEYLRLVQVYNSEPIANFELGENIASLGKEIWGQTSDDVYRGLLFNSLDPLLKTETDTPNLVRIQEDLSALMPKVSEVIAPYRPSDNTVEQMHVVADVLYGGLVSHIPADKNEFSPIDIAEVFRAALQSEFGDVAKDWRVELTPATSITVAAKEKIIRIPENRDPVDREKLRGLVAHEIGVHFLRSVMGSETDTLPLSVGLVGYGSCEEGLGKVMEQAINGKYSESGVDYYLITGMAQHDGFNFRNCFEVMWRKLIIEHADQGANVTTTEIAKARSSAYKKVFRIFRGTDTIAWPKDISYYEGSIKMWQYFESLGADELAVTMSLLGKADVNNPQQMRVVLESRSV